MKKKFLSILMVGAMVAALAGCGAADSDANVSGGSADSEVSAAEETAEDTPQESELSEAYQSFADCIDLDFTKQLIEDISSFGDDPATGSRISGSPANYETADYVKGVMEDIGLQNVTVDDATSDGWTFKGANLSYTNEEGEEVTVTLGGYETEIVADNEELQMVYLGRGTEADYEGVDATGKLVLIDIDQDNEWWINYPAYEAKIHGARAVIAMTEMQDEDPDRISMQDICGPADAPALAISQEDYEGLIQAMDSTDSGEITVLFNADSTIDIDSYSENIWGDIPGKSDEVIYMMAHYDGYFYSVYDDAFGMATILSIAKAIIDSGYEPEKTIRVIATGAEEFGKSGNEYDWGTGAYEEIVNIHPEWAENAFALVNLDGNFTVEGETNYYINTAYELRDFLEESGSAITDDCGYEYTYGAPGNTITEDFYWDALGIPSIAPYFSGEGVYEKGYYHSTKDSLEALPLDEDALLVLHQVYGKLVLDLDETAVRPMSFTAKLDALEESIDTDLVDDAELMDLIDEAKTAAAALEEKMAEVEDSGDADAAVALNQELYTLFKEIQSAFLRLDYELNVVFPTEQYQTNINALDGTIEALEAGNVQEAVDEYLWQVDWAWYSMYFSTEVCKYFEDQLWDNRDGTFGEGMIDYRQCDVDSTAKSLMAKYDDPDADVTEEIADLQQLCDQQAEYLDNQVQAEKDALTEIIDMMNEYSK